MKMPMTSWAQQTLDNRSTRRQQGQALWRGGLLAAGGLQVLQALWIPAVAGLPEVVPPMSDVELVARYPTDAAGQGPYAEISQAYGEKSYAGGQPLRPSRIENWILYYTNVEREAASLRPLTHDPAISTIARKHSQNMIRSGLFEHEINGKDPTDRALEAGYNCRAYHGDGSYSFGLSENIYEYPKITNWSQMSTEIVPTSFHSDQTMALALVRGWMNSPGHRRNILDTSARRIGIGVAIREHRIARSAGLRQETVFATQNFSSCQ
ncbi:MAG: hypothetical protein TQ37_08970 [Candidatus Synechococcus spongiarum 15L]|uniref:SCP domain-containing protein n=1 Tax=Candidatus Synechococcus spongiarum 15L TaxID=1608419 RepID=A0A0G8ARR8_9SYNE|nr:MAG: hypothetical protein TQ37_08970 [Candidatus Synechococcus spongiarum 15L]